MTKVFLSYWRGDSADVTARIHDRLAFVKTVENIKETGPEMEKFFARTIGITNVQ